MSQEQKADKSSMGPSRRRNPGIRHRHRHSEGETAENLGSFLPGRLLQKQRGHRSGPFHGPLDRPGPWRMGPGGKHGGAWECVYGGSAVLNMPVKQHCYCVI